MGAFLTSAAALALLMIPLAQARDPATVRTAAPVSDAGTLAAGWTALAAGRQDEAARDADTILRRRPWDRAALVLKITALSAAAPSRALDAYERWIAPGRPDDPGLIEPIAIGVLQEIAKSSDAHLQRDALKALVEAQVPGAREALDALPEHEDARLTRDAAAARSGDTAAAERLLHDAGLKERATPLLADALAASGTSGEGGLLLLLDSADAPTRAAAARHLGAMKLAAARPALQKRLQDPDPVVRTSATVSLAQLGDPGALDSVDRMLASGVPDVQLAAADVWGGQPGPWVPVVRTLLDNMDGLTRLQAARAIAPVDPEAARRVLAGALADPNPVIRLESARTLSDTVDRQPATADVAALRQRLRDRDRAVRLQAASVLLKLARA
jgi:hypothetical protein